MEDGDREKTEPPMGAVLARNQWASNSQDRMGYVKRRLGRAFRAGVGTPVRNGGGKSRGFSRRISS